MESDHSTPGATGPGTREPEPIDIREFIRKRRGDTKATTAASGSGSEAPNPPSAKAPPGQSTKAPPKAPSSGKPAPQRAGPSRDDPTAFERAKAYLAEMDPAISGAGGHKQTFKVASVLVRRFRLSESDALALLRSDYNPRCEPPWTDRELEHKVREASRKSTLPDGDLLDAPMPEQANRPIVRNRRKRERASGQASGRDGTGGHREERCAERGDGSPNGLITIYLGTDEHRVVDDIVRAYVTSGAEVFQNGGRLVRVGSTDDGTLTIKQLVRGSVQVELSKIAQVIAPTEYGDREKALPDRVADQVLYAAEWTGIRRLRGIVAHPVFREDGTVAMESGYDAATELWLDLREPITIPATPSREDAVRACGVLLDVVRDFPFVSDAHRSAWLAGLLTPYVRHLIPTAPITLVGASVRGSGKTLLARIIGLVAVGRHPDEMQPTKEEEEIRKAITSIAASGKKIVLIDNAVDLGSPCMSGALTSSVWSDRILGSNVQGSWPLDVTWLVTGNNVRLRDDVIRRINNVRLEPDCEFPEKRTGFACADLEQWVTQNRPRLLAAALTILRAYIVAGRPDVPMQPLGSYRAWLRWVCAPIVWCGLRDPTESRQELEGQDPEREGLLLTFTGLHEHRDMLTSSDIVKLMRDEQFGSSPVMCKVREGLEALNRTGKTLDAQRVGYILRRYNGKIVGGLKLQSVLDRKELARWEVVKCH